MLATRFSRFIYCFESSLLKKWKKSLWRAINKRKTSNDPLVSTNYLKSTDLLNNIKNYYVETDHHQRKSVQEYRKTIMKSFKTFERTKDRVPSSSIERVKTRFVSDSTKRILRNQRKSNFFFFFSGPWPTNRRCT